MARSRRTFLQTVVYAGLGGYLAVAVGACRRTVAIARRRPAGPAFFTAAEYQTMAAATERILPHDDEDPGAIELGVPVYVDRALAQDDYLHWADHFRESIHDLDTEATNRWGKAFHLIDPGEQDDILDAFESGVPPHDQFFHMLMHLTLEGAFGDPSHGGNRDGRGWRLIGFAPGEPMPGMHH